MPKKSCIHHVSLCCSKRHAARRDEPELNSQSASAKAARERHRKLVASQERDVAGDARGMSAVAWENIRRLPNSVLGRRATTASIESLPEDLRSSSRPTSPQNNPQRCVPRPSSRPSSRKNGAKRRRACDGCVAAAPDDAHAPPGPPCRQNCPPCSVPRTRRSSSSSPPRPTLAARTATSRCSRTSGNAALTVSPPPCVRARLLTPHRHPRH